MSWRLPAPGGYHRYATVCAMDGCGLLRGWDRRAAALAHVNDLRSVGTETHEPEEYVDGADGTCPHGVSLDAHLPARKTRARTQR